MDRNRVPLGWARVGGVDRYGGHTISCLFFVIDTFTVMLQKNKWKLKKSKGFFLVGFVVVFLVLFPSSSVIKVINKNVLKTFKNIFFLMPKNLFMN